MARSNPVNARGQRICGAKTRRPPGTCQSTAVIPPSNRCRMHGGTTPRGAASPHFKHGRRSKYLPKGLLDSYQSALRDPSLLELREDVALADARIDDLLRKWSAGRDDATLALRLAQRAWSGMKAANASKNPDAIAAAAAELDDVLTRPVLNEAVLREELRKEQREKRRLVETETRRRVLERFTIPHEEAQSLFVALSEAINQHVPDLTVRAAISSEFQRLVSRNGQPALDAQYRRDDDDGG